MQQPFLKRISQTYPEAIETGRWKPKIPKADEIENALYVRRIRKAFPEFENADCERIDDVGDFLMYLVNDRYIFRFVIGNKVEDILKLLSEQAVLERPKERLVLPAPNYTHVPEAPDFSGFEMIRGQALSPDCFRQLSSSNREAAAKILGENLGIIHAFPVEQAKALGVEEGRPRSPRGAERRFRRSGTELEPHVRRVYERWLGDIQTMPDYTPAFTHSDVWYHHIYHDPRSGRLTGIIDWGDIRITDPAYDIAGSWAYGKAFVDAVLRNYPATDSAIKDRALYHYKSTVIGSLLNPRERYSNYGKVLLSDNFDL